MEAVEPAPERVGLVLDCEGMGDCLFAQAVIRVFPLDDARLKAYPHQTTRLFELDKLPHWRTDTFDFISFPLGLGGLSFREKELEYFPTEPDEAQAFDVVLNTSMTWPTRSWPIGNWQRLADELLARGLVLGMSIEWSKRAIYRNENPHHKVTCATRSGCRRRALSRIFRS